jgi:hypothetical protein
VCRVLELWILANFRRLSCGAPGRLPRIVPEPGADFSGYYLPAGVSLLPSSFNSMADEIVLCIHVDMGHASQ